VPERLNRKQRSWNMARIRSHNTKPEIAVRRVLHRAGYRFRYSARRLPGNPDVVLPRWKTVVFVHGCFWHQHRGCIDCSKPATNTNYWLPKLARNVDRDRTVTRLLRRAGWEVVVVWECESKDSDAILSRVARAARRTGLHPCHMVGSQNNLRSCR
jgi:DNA mismatch endonuclease (patch repair protein)